MLLENSEYQFIAFVKLKVSGYYYQKIQNVKIILLQKSKYQDNVVREIKISRYC